MNEKLDELLKELTIHKKERILAARLGAVQLHNDSKTNSINKENTINNI